MSSFLRVPEFQKIALSRILIFPFQIYYVAILAFVSYFVLNKTVLGKQILAVGGNEKASNLTGIPTKELDYLYMDSQDSAVLLQD